MTPDRVRRNSAIDLRLRVRQARGALCGSDGLYEELGASGVSDRLRAVCTELSELEQCLADIAEQTRAPLHFRGASGGG
jgi:hypothetical protein